MGWCWGSFCIVISLKHLLPKVFASLFFIDTDEFVSFPFPLLFVADKNKFLFLQVDRFRRFWKIILRKRFLLAFQGRRTLALWLFSIIITVTNKDFCPLQCPTCRRPLTLGSYTLLVSDPSSVWDWTHVLLTQEIGPLTKEPASPLRLSDFR